MSKIEMKINRYVKHIGEDDLILNNGASIQVVTQRGGYYEYRYDNLKMSKQLFKNLLINGFIFMDQEQTLKANAKYKQPFLNYYRFNIDKMIESGYPVVEE